MSLGFLQRLRQDHEVLQSFTKGERQVVLDGRSLDVPSIVAVASYSTKAKLTDDEAVLKSVENSVKVLQNHLDRGSVIYGVNTGLGSNGDSRPTRLAELQKSTIQQQNVGALTLVDRGKKMGESVSKSIDDAETLAMPTSLVRGMMLIRCDSLLRGHSGVRRLLIESINTLLSHGITPVIPLRGSISASGDLMPLSYIAGTLEGNKNIYTRLPADATQTVRVVSAAEALSLSDLQPIVYGPKEALGLLNGTAASCAAASLAIYQARNLAALAQLTTSMGTEALLGSRYNHDPFISQTRPHEGQQEAAEAMFSFLKGSRLTAERGSGLQDRYGLRTSSQWIGPQLEDLTLALRQIEVELKSTTDNPLIDTENDLIHNGGNFQATVLTSAMDKTLTALQSFGRLAFAQSSELLNSTLNKGLPPNLAIDNPSTSFTFKGVDINMAAYMSELASLAHSVGPFAQSAEQHNQSVNSLALLAARRVTEAIKVLSLMNASYLYSLCQALDLRCLQIEFATSMEFRALALLRETVGAKLAAEIHPTLWSAILDQWLANNSLDLEARCHAVSEGALGRFVTAVQSGGGSSSKSVKLEKLMEYKDRLAALLHQHYNAVREAFIKAPTSTFYLGKATRILHDYVRNVLKVPLHRGFVDDPTVTDEEIQSTPGFENLGRPEKDKKAMGTHISTIYEAIRSGDINKALMRCLE